MIQWGGNKKASTPLRIITKSGWLKITHLPPPLASYLTRSLSMLGEAYLAVSMGSYLRLEPMSIGLIGAYLRDLIYPIFPTIT